MPFKISHLPVILVLQIQNRVTIGQLTIPQFTMPAPSPQHGFRETINIPIAIPAWGIISALITGAFAFGILYNQLSALVKNQEKVDLMYERQIKNISDVNRHERAIENHEQRIQALERVRK